MHRKEERLEKDKFYEGATWMAKQQVSVCEDGLKKF